MKKQENTYGYHADLIQQNKRERHNRQKNTAKWLLTKWRVFCFPLLFLSIFWGIGHRICNKIIYDTSNSVHYEPETLPPVLTAEGAPNSNPDYVTNILLIATDKRNASDTGRADVMLLLSYNESDNHFNLISFQRDLYLPLFNQEQHNRLNASYTYGGPECTVKTIEEVFNIDIDNYACIDMFQAYEYIDAIGGVNIELTKEEAILVNSYVSDINYRHSEMTDLNEISGKQHLNGKQALSYCRIRALEGGDYSRTNRQRNTISALIQQLKRIALRPHLWNRTYKKLMNAMNTIQTDMTEEDMKILLKRIPYLAGSETFSYTVPADTTWKYDTIDNMKVITCDPEKNEKFLKKILY